MDYEKSLIQGEFDTSEVSYIGWKKLDRNFDSNKIDSW